MELAATAAGRLLFRGRPGPAPAWLADLYLLTVAVAPRLPVEPLAGYGLGLDDAAWAALTIGALRRPAPKAALALPLAAALFVGALSILFRAVPSPVPGFLTLAKLGQLFGAYLAARALGLDPPRLARAACRAILLLGVVGGAELLARRGLAEGPRLMVYRIFDTPWYPGQTNHVAGFVAVMLPAALLERDRLLRAAAALVGSALVALTASRAGIVALSAAILVMVIGRRRALGLLLLAALALLMSGPGARRRLALLADEWSYFQSEMARRAAGMPPGNTEGRFRLMVAWIALDEWRQAPLLGTGLGSRHRVFYESALVMIPAETGLLGLAAALATAAALARLPARDPPAWRAALIAFLLLGAGAVTIVVTRIAAPFWLAAAALEEA